MLEQAIERLTVEVQKLREAIEEQTAQLARDDKRARCGVQPGFSENRRGLHHGTGSRGTTGLSVTPLRRWRKVRKGPPFRKFGRLVRYSRAEGDGLDGRRRHAAIATAWSRGALALRHVRAASPVRIGLRGPLLAQGPHGFDDSVRAFEQRTNVLHIEPALFFSCRLRAPLFAFESRV